jgi:2,5-furandicarboxylate decarboxylase 1
MLIMRNPLTGAQNVSINRCQLNGPNRLGVLIATRDTRLFYDTAEARGVALEIALVIGADPLALLASQIAAPAGQDELEIAGALRGKPLDVVKCRTNSVRVPADAEIVLEGRMLAEVREQEGPFGEFQQVYAERGLREVIEVDLLAHRRNPIFQAIVSGGKEHVLLGSIPKEASLLNSLQQSFPNVLEVHLSMGGSGRFHANIRIRKRTEGEAKNIIMAAFGANPTLKQVTVVDDDIDIYAADTVEWAMATRCRADRDLIVVANALCAPLDPTAENGVGAKLGIDATKPLGTTELRYTRTVVPGENDVVLEDVLAAAPGPNWRTVLDGG